MNTTLRREFLKQTTALGAAVAAFRGMEALAGTPLPAGQLPAIRLGGVEVSRLLLGSNPFFGFAHKKDDTGKRMRAFYTDERVMAVLDEAADHGITAVWTPCYDHWIRLWNRYQERGGKLKIWVGQPDPKPELMKSAITACAKNGGRAICIQGERIDQQVQAGRWDVVRDWLEHIKSYGLPAGMATHRPQTHLMAEERGMPTDFYHQCVYQPENYSQKCLELALATIRKLNKPVVAYKVLAAGRIRPETAFTRLFAHLKPKDGLCVGVFPRDNAGQVAENASLAQRLSAQA